MGRPVVHFEIGCGNSEAAGDFYCKLFDEDSDRNVCVAWGRGR